MFGRKASVVAAVSAARVCASTGGTPAATVEDWPTRKLFGFVRPKMAERVRKRSVAKSIQRTNAHWVALCRAAKVLALLANPQW